MITTTTKAIGDIGEDAAAEYLKKNRYRILERHYRSGRCEIDLIAEGDDHTVFVEVKARTAGDANESRFGRPARAVDAEKQKNLLTAAYAWLRAHPGHKAPRMDVIEVYLQKKGDTVVPGQIVHIRNAFGAR